MRAYLVRRLLLIIPTLFLVTVIAFCAVRFIPGSVIDLMVAEMAAESTMPTELTAEHIRHELGMDVPIYVQYARWAVKAVQGDLGRSIWYHHSVTQEVLRGLPVTLELGLLALTTAVLIAIPIGVYSAVRQDTLGDYSSRTFAILLISLPPFWVGTLIMVYPSIWWGWSPPVQLIPFVDDPLANLSQFLLPAVIQGMAMSGTTMRMTRTMMLEVLRQDYIRTAWAKGLRERTIVIRHATKNALIPVISHVGTQIGIVLSLTVVIEQIFCLPGIGFTLMEALNKRDYPMITGINLFIAGFVLISNLAVDISYAYLDPRVHYR
ncbi:ABC transporter permease [Chloroflexota bacterium]